LVAFLAAQAAIVSARLTGPFVDESIYLTAGRRTLEGFGGSDSYLTWFAGSLLWPAMAAAAHAVGGLEGARLIAAACVATGIWGASHAAGTLFGERTRPWTALVLCTSGVVVQLGHLAVYDAPAVAATGVALAAVAETHRRDDRVWLGLAALALALAGLAKYPVLLFAAVPLTACVVALRGRRALLDLVVLAFVSGAVLMVFFLLEREQLVRFLDFRVRQNPSFGTTRAMVGFQLAYFAMPAMLLALAGTLLTGSRALAIALLLGPLMPVLYHLGSGTAVGVDKHVVFVLLFAAPLAGVALERAWSQGRARRGLVAGLLVLATGVAAMQCVRIDRSWLDVRPSVAFLAERVRPGERLLIDNSWPYVERLYRDARIATPFDVYDLYRVDNDWEGRSLCGFDWYVESPGASGWPARISEPVRRCGTFVKVFQQRGFRRVGLGRDLRYFGFDANVVVYRRVAS